MKNDSDTLIDENGDIVVDDDSIPNAEPIKKYMESLPPYAYKYLMGIRSKVKKRKEVPYVMSIEGGFGSGKTHFVTRFCQYMMDHGMEVVYSSMFEYDSIDPKIAILETMLKDGWIGSAKKKFGRIIRNMSTEISIPFFSVSLSKLQLKDEMERAREALQKKIKEKGQLLFVIDELDRCNPHFCINLLETVKHFFDINGIFVILSFNRRTILRALSSIYGIDFLKDIKGENYLTKFIDERTEIYY